MYLIWSPAITLDGYIAKLDGDSGWPTETDGEQFQELVKKCRSVIVGRKTFDQYKGDVFPIAGATTFVWTRHPDTGDKYEGTEYISGTPSEVIELLEKKGFAESVLAGGSMTNDAFVGANLVDEISVTIYPLLFGKGMRLLSVENCELKLEILETKMIGDGVIKIKYKVLKG